MKLIAAFDIAPPLVGQEFSGTAIHHVDQLERYLSQNPASIGVLTVPRGWPIRSPDAWWPAA